MIQVSTNQFCTFKHLYSEKQLLSYVLAQLNHLFLPSSLRLNKEYHGPDDNGMQISCSWKCEVKQIRWSEQNQDIELMVLVDNELMSHFECLATWQMEYCYLSKEFKKFEVDRCLALRLAPYPHHANTLKNKACIPPEEYVLLSFVFPSFVMSSLNQVAKHQASDKDLLLLLTWMNLLAKPSKLTEPCALEYDPLHILELCDLSFVVSREMLDTYFRLPDQPVSVHLSLELQEQEEQELLQQRQTKVEPVMLIDGHSGLSMEEDENTQLVCLNDMWGQCCWYLKITDFKQRTEYVKNMEATQIRAWNAYSH